MTKSTCFLLPCAVVLAWATFALSQPSEREDRGPFPQRTDFEGRGPGHLEAGPREHRHGGPPPHRHRPFGHADEPWAQGGRPNARPRPAGPPTGPPFGPFFGPPPNRLLDALDADQDHELSASEIDNAAAALKSLDRNDDGKLTDEELRRPHPPGGPRQFDGPPHRRSERRPHDDIEDAPPHRPTRGPNAKGPAEKPRPHEPRENDLSKPNRKPPRGPVPPGPAPERLVRDALSFDSDEDGKLDREELEAFFRRLSPREAGEKPPHNPSHAERPERPPSD